MEAAPKPTIDWIYPPPGIVETDLYAALHDAVIVAIESDAERTFVSFVFSHKYLAKSIGCDADLRFVFRFEGVRSVRALGYVNSAGDLNIPDGVTHEDAFELFMEHKRQAHIESLAWSSLQPQIDNLHPEVLEANLIQNEENCAMKIEARTRTRDWIELRIAAEGFSVSRSDGVACDLGKLLAIGEAFWDS
jgi:hypothetical protein